MSSFVSNPFNMALPTPVTQGTGDTKRWLVDERPRSAVGGPFHLCSPLRRGLEQTRSPRRLMSLRSPLADSPGFGELSWPVWYAPCNAGQGRGVYLDLATMSQGKPHGSHSREQMPVDVVLKPVSCPSSATSCLFGLGFQKVSLGPNWAGEGTSSIWDSTVTCAEFPACLSPV